MDVSIGRRSVIARIDNLGRPVPAESAVGEVADGGESDGGFTPADEKYEVVAEIGQGGMGEVALVQDRDLRREVAMKVLRSEFAEHAAMKRKFVAEAQATSQLEHPGIPPVHDIGLTPAGNVYFTMKIVRGKNLSAVLKELLLGSKSARQEWTLHRLATVLERVCEAVHFAHEKGVIHRDLKPDNIMLGEFGEVHVMDWGIAKVTTSTDVEEEIAGVTTVETENSLMTQIGTVKGTVPYMSPEQARGAELDRRTDVYALGAILYEMLTLHPAFSGPIVQVLLKVRNSDYPPVETRNPRRPVPEALADLSRRAMSKDPAQRPATANDFREEIRKWLDGRAERERRHKEAEALTAQGRDELLRFAAARAAVESAESEAKEAEANFQSWQSVDECAPVLAARERATLARDEAAEAFADAANLFAAALVAEPEHPAARSALGEMWKGRLDEAEHRAVRDDAAFALRMIRRLNDASLAAYVTGDGSLELATEPEGAEVTLFRYEDHHGVLRPGEGSVLGVTPLAPVQLPMGSYLAVLRHARFPEVRYPVHITRNRVWRGNVKLRTAKEIGEGFVYVPGGPFVSGEVRATAIVDVADFAIQRTPVTFGDWALFLAAVEKEQGLDAARRYVPNVRGDGDFMGRLEDGTWHALSINCEGEARERCIKEHGPDFYSKLPVAGVSWFDALAYCEWRARVTGMGWRLPSDAEREKAARGVDGRRFPWGDLEHSTLGKCRDSREEATQPEPVGSFPTAASVYGMLDASGNSWDWTDSWFDASRTARVARGGAWNSSVSFLRCAARLFNVPENRFTNVGLRCARTL